jgi:hypothetical protein
MRFALINLKPGQDEDDELRRVKRFLPSNYDAVIINDGILIAGNDSAGWTLDGYVIPRLASGLIFAKETAPPLRWTAGWNMPGYLPETDPETFTEWKDARAYLIETIDRFWDEDYDGGNHGRTASDEKWLHLHTQLPLASEDESFVMMNGDGSLVFWITQATNEDFNIAGDGN